MNDPFSKLKNTLSDLFQMELKRNGKYIYTEIRQLEKSLENYQPNNKIKFKELIKALHACMPRIEKWRLDFNALKKPIDSLAKDLDEPLINWDSWLSRSNASPKFQFSALNNQKKDLLTWLVEASGMQNDTNTHVRMLLDYRDRSGFSPRLSAHLKKDPEFLFRLIMKSNDNFKQISNTRLILYLTDQQLAEAIIKHIPRLQESDPDPKNLAQLLVKELNSTLSNGRSVSTLLRNIDAKLILDQSELLQIYQNTDLDQSEDDTLSSQNTTPSI